MSSRDVLDSHRSWWPGSWPAPFAVLFLIAACAAAAPAPNRIYTLASGSAQGVYLPLARDIATIAHQAGVEIRVLPSEGSRQNLFWLAEGRADLALAQSDVAWEAYTGHGGFARPLTGLRAIAPLYTEAVHILIHRPLYVHRIEDLRGKRVAVGPAGSGTEANASQVLAAAGLTIHEVAALHLPVEEAMAAMRRGELDAAFVTSGVPSAAVAGVLEDGSATLFEPDQDLMDRLQEALPFFLNKNVEPADYRGLGEQVTTVGVQALLVGRGDLPEAMVDTLVHALSASPRLRAKYRLSGLGTAADEAAIPTFGPARRYYAIQSLLQRRKLILGIIAALLVLVFAAARFQGSLWRLFRRDDFLRVGVYFSVVWIAGSLALFGLERRVNDNYSTLWKSMWSGLITVYSLSGKEPLTFEGRVVGIIIYLLGVAGLVWLTEKLASFYVEKKIIPLFRSGFARMHKMKDHYVIAGWNEKGPGIVAQLHGEDLNERRLIVILAREDQTGLPSNALVHTERGERASEEALRRTNVQAAHSVIVLADDKDPAADARTILAILAVRKICSEQNPARQVPVIAEILDPKNVSLATFAGGEGGGTLEIVSSHQMGQGLLTQAAVHPGLSSLFRQLLRFGKGDSEIHRVQVPERFVRDKWSFERLAQWSLEQRSQGVDVIPIAIQRGQEVHINPGSGKLDLLQEGDFLFAICDSPRELEKFYL